MFKRVLIANRGEIAVRIVRACHDLGVLAIAVFSEADRDALHVRLADEAYPIGPAAPTESYLNVEQIIAKALVANADAIHPGYGFLSENPALAAAAEAAGISFVGPGAEAIRAMGCKETACDIASRAGLPTSRRATGPWADENAMSAAAESVGYPLLVKATAGGGGRGMRRVRSRDELVHAHRAARSEAEAAFGNGHVMLERFVERARHVEVQVLADHHGTVAALGCRECSVQRRHQKVIEEAPAPSLPTARREQLEADSCALARTIGYRNVGTVEWLLDESGEPSFLEMNTRLQVEHPVSEERWGIDLVTAQMRLAAGHRLADVLRGREERGHAIECRIYAEDPARQFLPSPGRLSVFRGLEGTTARIDTGYVEGDLVPVEYDPLIAKLIVRGRDRAEAIARASQALSKLTVLGVRTNLGLLRAVLEHSDVMAGPVHTTWLEEHLDTLLVQHTGLPLAFVAAAALEAHAGAARPSQNPRQSPWHQLGAWSSTSSFQTAVCRSQTDTVDANTDENES